MVFLNARNSPPPEGWILSKKEDGVVEKQQPYFSTSVSIIPTTIYKKFCSLTARCWIQRRNDSAKQTTPSKILLNFRHPSGGGEFRRVVFYTVFVLHFLNLN